MLTTQPDIKDEIRAGRTVVRSIGIVAHWRTRMHPRAALVAALLLSTAAIVGCSSSSPPSSSAAAVPASAASPSAAGAASSDAAACAGFGDVLTVTFNADVALREGRIEQQEHDGWYRVATRVLDRLSLGDGGAVDEAVAALQDAAPSIASGASGASGIGSAAWNDAQSRLSTACEEAGSALAIEAFTGG